jgi:hypothetical protein
MSRCSPLGEVAAVVAEVENMEEIMILAELEHTFGENPAASNGERYAASPNAEDDLDEGDSDNVKLRTCYFGSSTITMGKIKEMEEKGYFPKGEARAPGVETVPKPNGDEAIVYKDFFITGLHMPLHSALADILLHLQGAIASINTQRHHAAIKKILGSRQLRWCAFREFVCEMLLASLSAEYRVNPRRRSNRAVQMPKFLC